MPDFETLEIFRALLDSLQIGVYLVDREHKIRFWNAGAKTITGYQHHEVVGHSSRASVLDGCDDVGCFLCGTKCPLTEVEHQGKPTEAQVFLHHKSGQRVPVHMRAVPIRNAHGSIVCTAVSFEENRSPADPEFHDGSLAAHGCLDVLTGTPNHVFTQSHLRENLAFFDEYNLPFGILCMQVEQLPQLQATHGRESVDVMLHVIAQTMKHTLKPDGLLGRWTDNQFLAIVTYCDDAQLDKVGRNLQKMASRSGIRWWDDLLVVNVSVGYAMVQPGDTVETLVERAQNALPAAPLQSAAAAAGTPDESSRR